MSRKWSYWGESPDLEDDKYEINEAYMDMSAEKRARIESIMPFDAVEEEQTLIIENEVVSQTIELMTNSNTIKSMMDAYNQDTSDIKPPLPTITLSAETRACLDQLNKPVNSPFYIPKNPSDFYEGKPKTYPPLTKPVALEAICKALTGLIRLRGFDDCTESSLIMFMDGVEEFYKCLLDKVNHVITTEDKDLNRTFDVITLEKAYMAVNGTSLTQLHNYYKNEVVNRNRYAILKFMDTHDKYEKLAEESENVSNIMLKEEYVNLINESQSKDLSPESSNMNDSDASSFSYKDSSHSYDRQQSDDNISVTFSVG